MPDKKNTTFGENISILPDIEPVWISLEDSEATECLHWYHDITTKMLKIGTHYYDIKYDYSLETWNNLMIALNIVESNIIQNIDLTCCIFSSKPITECCSIAAHSSDAVQIARLEISIWL